MGKDCVVTMWLFLACCWDLRKKRIPNGLILAGAAACLLFSAAEAPPGTGALLHLGDVLIRGGAVVAAGSFLWRLRMVGAADVKLAALIVSWLGVGRGCSGLGAGMVLGALWSLGRLFRKGELLLRLRQLARYGGSCLKDRTIRPYERWIRDGDQAVIPLGACLALGTILTLWL